MNAPAWATTSTAAVAAGEESGGPLVTRLPLTFHADDRRVITLPFLPGGGARVRAILERIAALNEEQVAPLRDEVRRDYGSRHRDLDAVCHEHYTQAAALSGWRDEWSNARRLLAGAYFTMEYAVESAALFNPSIVAHPEQSGLAEGELRFILSLRATGEGHVSSIVFRTGTLDRQGMVTMDPAAAFSSRARMRPDRRYMKPLIQRKLEEMGVQHAILATLLAYLPDPFSLQDLHQAIMAHGPEIDDTPGAHQAAEHLLWLARANRTVELAPGAELSELVFFPITEDESRGVEDLRLVRFTEDDGAQRYYGTYTAYNGYRTLPMLVRSDDFRQLQVHTLNGACAINKGMALFPRRIQGHYVMCSRIDGENLFISYSDYEHFWESAQRLAVPRAAWELVQLGNCGSPIETPEGWLLLTHGVGPMRTYAIGAMLLDLNDPTRIIGQLPRPLIAPGPQARHGYVPNVVYTCGALVHEQRLFIPYALADSSTAMARVELPALVEELLRHPPATV